MKRRKVYEPILVTGAALVSTSMLAFADPPAGNWSATPTFFDDFNGTSLDTTKWSKGYRWADVVNNEMQGFVPEKVTVSGGYCTLKVEKRTVQNTDWVGYKTQTQSYASGAIQTYNKFAQAHGYFEVRAKRQRDMAGNYRLTPQSDATKSLKVYGASTADLANVEISNYTGASNQKWIFTNMGNSLYEIKAVNSGKDLDVVGNYPGDNINVDQYAPNGQRWKLELSDTPGYYRLTPLVSSTRALTTSGTANNSNAFILTYSNLPGQEWKIDFLSP